jgi:hypothetical protein
LDNRDGKTTFDGALVSILRVDRRI